MTLGGREPLFNIPRSLLAVLLLLLGVHVVRLWLPEAADADLLARFAFVPGRAALAIDPAGVEARLAGLAARSPDDAEVGRFFLGSGSPQPWTVLTYALLHGNWSHLGLNALWLLAFGAPIARRVGPWRFLLLLVACAVAGAAAHDAVDPLSLQPLIGASAAVSGCMGAVLRVAFQPERVRRPVETAPRQSLRAVFANPRALAFLAVWLLSNFVTGIGAVPLGLSDMPIAWQAHVGGFALGLFAFALFDRPRSPPDHPADEAPSET